MSKLAMGFRVLAARGYLKWLPDKTFLKIQYRLNMHKKLNLKNPKTFNEKMQWMKLYDRNPDYIRMVDKYAVKKWVAEKIGEEHIIPTLGVWEHSDEIDFDKLPDRFVLKCTHDSGSIVLCKNKADFNTEAARKKMDAHLKMNYYEGNREWPYKDVKPRIIAEPYLEDAETGELRDFKFYCFNGNPEIIGVFRKRFSEDGLKAHFLDMSWNAFDSSMFGYSPTDYAVPKPKNFNEMVRLAKELSSDIPHVRVDLYEINGKVYFGEMTFFPMGGYRPMTDEWDEKLGQMLVLPSYQP